MNEERSAHRDDVELGAEAVEAPASPRLASASPRAPLRAETRVLLKNAAVPPGGFEQQSAQFGEKHGFLLFKVFERSAYDLEGLAKDKDKQVGDMAWWPEKKKILQKRVNEYFKGFTRDHWIIFLQTFVAYVIVLGIISPDAVYNALSYGGSFQPVWGIIYLLMVCTLGGTVGVNTLLQGYVVVSLVFAGCFGLWVRHMTYLAAGSDWSNNNVAKGATYSLLMSLSCGLFNILRWRWDVTNPLFFLCSIFLIFTQGSYSGPNAGTLYLQVCVAFVCLLTCVARGPSAAFSLGLSLSLTRVLVCSIVVAGVQLDEYRDCDVCVHSRVMGAVSAVFRVKNAIRDSQGAGVPGAGAGGRAGPHPGPDRPRDGIAFRSFWQDRHNNRSRHRSL